MIFSSKCTIMHFVVWLCPNPLEKLIMLPRSPTWIYGVGGAPGQEVRERKRRERTRREGENSN